MLPLCTGRRVMLERMCKLLCWGIWYAYALQLPCVERIHCNGGVKIVEKDFNFRNVDSAE